MFIFNYFKENKMKQSKIIFLFTLITFCMPIFTSDSYENQWIAVQDTYNNVYKEIETRGLFSLDQLYLHPYWLTNKHEIRKILLAEPQRNFLKNNIISGTMVRSGIGNPQLYELCYLKHCLSKKTTEQLALFKESDFGQLSRECTEFNCSSNTLGHLFYAAKVLENQPSTIQRIIEFGSGYGNLAHIFKTIVPGATIFLIDLPEFLAFQMLFLQASMPEVSIYFHSTIPTTYQENAIHLIPVYLLENFDIKTDVFISTMALSETTETLQRLIIKKNFFDAEMSYISGQLNGWGTEHNFASHTLIVNALRNFYKNISYQPLHFVLGGLLSYEIIGKHT